MIHGMFDYQCLAFAQAELHHGATLVQAALERQDLSCTYLAHHELESIMIIILL